MPFDGSPPLPKTPPAAEILLYAEVKFLSNRWTWIQDAWGERPTACLAMAIERATADKGFGSRDHGYALELVARILDLKPYKQISSLERAIAKWNDAKGRTEAEIIAVLRQAQELAYGDTNDRVPMSPTLPVGAGAGVRSTAVEAIVTAERCRILTAILLRHPKILPGVADACERLALPAPFDEIHQSITRRSGKGRLKYPVRGDLGPLVDKVLRQSRIPLPAIASRKGAERIWWRMFSLVPKKPVIK